jgi:hypothetical protein
MEINWHTLILELDSINQYSSAQGYEATEFILGKDFCGQAVKDILFLNFGYFTFLIGKCIPFNALNSTINSSSSLWISLKSALLIFSTSPAVINSLNLFRQVFIPAANSYRPKPLFARFEILAVQPNRLPKFCKAVNAQSDGWF